MGEFRETASAEGAFWPEQIKMHGVVVPVRARVETLDSLSAHADREEILRWIGFFARRRARRTSSTAIRLVA